MADKSQFRTIVTDSGELERKIREHRRKIRKNVLIVLCLILGAAAAAVLFVQFRTCTSYVQEHVEERQDSSACRFVPYGKGFIKYNNDGAIYTDADNHLYWNQSFEMQTPIIAMCEDYVAFAEQGGTKVYILNQNGIQGEVDTAMKIDRIQVANQGTIAVWMEHEGTNYLRMYDKHGSNLAKGALHVENSGYPLDIALCNDGKKLAVSMLNISEGKVASSIRFYNFGSVGQNEIDNLVGNFDYGETIIPEIRFVSNDRMVAFGDSRIVVFEGTQKPQPKTEIALEHEIKSVFCNEKYIGVIYNTEEKSGENRHIDTYDMNGKRVVNRDFSMDYQSAEFLDNGEICICGENECLIFSAYGIKRFEYTFDQTVYKILSRATALHYTFILEGTTEKVRLK